MSDQKITGITLRQFIDELLSFQEKVGPDVEVVLEIDDGNLVTPTIMTTGDLMIIL